MADVLAFLIVAWFVAACFLIDWDIREVCDQQIGGGGELTTVLSAHTAAATPEIYDWAATEEGGLT